jgi:hypothetical protein
MAARPVTVRILHPEPVPSAGPIERWVSSARAELAERHLVAFRGAGAADVAIVRGRPDHTPFGERLRALVLAERPAGLVVLGSGAIPLATERDYRDLVATAGLEARRALANNRYSADVVAIACAEVLAGVPDLPGDNALPRWLSEVAGYDVADLRARWRLALDIDGPLELVLLGRDDTPRGVDVGPLRERLAAVRSITADRRVEMVISGRVSVATLAWLERRVPSRIRAIVEERGLRASARLAMADGAEAKPVLRERSSGRSGHLPTQRPAASLLGALLDRDGPGALGRTLAALGEAAVVDTRVLLAHRLGSDEAAWPPPEDRFASDLLLADRIDDPWLRALTAAAAGAPIPILLGGHSLVGAGIRVLLGRGGVGRMSWS